MTPAPSPAKEHRWSGWPGAYCMDCGAEDKREYCPHSPSCTTCGGSGKQRDVSSRQMEDCDICCGTGAAVCQDPACINSACPGKPIPA